MTQGTPSSTVRFPRFRLQMKTRANPAAATAAMVAMVMLSGGAQRVPGTTPGRSDTVTTA